MKKFILPMCMIALMVLPAAGALAKVGQGKQPVGNGKLQVPPGLVNSETKILAKIESQVADLEASMAALDEALLVAEGIGDLAQQAALLEEENSLMAQITRLNDKRINTEAAIDAKIAAWQLKHGISGPVEPPPQ